MVRAFLSSLLCLLAVAGPAGASSVDELLDRWGDALTFSSADQALRARVSGLLDLEGYHTPHPRSDLRFHAGDWSFQPRLTLFLDAQAGTRTYVFAQARVDRGLDPTNDALRARLDELAVRFALASRGRLNLQAGKFATVVGTWSPRHHSWENPFVTAPLPYENLTAMWDRSATVSTTQLLRRAHVVPASGDAGLASDKTRRLPVIWGPVYASGAAVAGKWGRLEYAVEAKNAALSARPEAWDLTDRPWGPATLGGRVGFRPSEMWNVGLSASQGTYLSRSAIPTVPSGTNAGDHRQTVAGADVSFAHRHLQIWAEIYHARWAIPALDDLRTTGYYIEVKYKFLPQLFGAVRGNQQTFSRVAHPAGGTIRWGRNISRVDFALIHRLSAHLQAKIQYSPQHETPAPRKWTHAVAAQLTARF